MTDLKSRADELIIDALRAHAIASEFRFLSNDKSAWEAHESLTRFVSPHKPLGIELFAGLSGWGEGLAAEGFRVVGFDIEDMPRALGLPRPAGDVQLVLQDVLTLHGRQFRDAHLIVASPPCQEFSYMAMPWSRAKQIEREYQDGTRDRAQLTALFDACFRIQREACDAAGRHIPLIVENVKGAQKWVGRSRWNFGSYHLWGDVPALMPMAVKSQARKNPGFRFDGSGKSFQTHSVETTGRKSSGLNWSDRTKRGQDFTRVAGNQAAGIKHHASGATWFDTGPAGLSSKSSKRKAASALIAKIPLPLSRHIARIYKPQDIAA